MAINFEQLTASNIMLQISAKDLKDFANKLLLDREKEMDIKIREQNEEQYYSTKEVQAKFKVSRQTIFTWQKKGFVRARKLGGKNVWLHSEIEKMMYVKY